MFCPASSHSNDINATTSRDVDVQMVEPTVVVHLQDTNNDDRDKSVSMLCDSCCVCFLIAVIKGFDFVTFRGLCHVALRLKENAILQTLWSCFKRRYFSCERFFNEKLDEAHPFFCTTGKMVRCSLRPCDFNDKDGPCIRTFLRHIFVKNQQKKHRRPSGSSLKRY